MRQIAVVFLCYILLFISYTNSESPSVIECIRDESDLLLYNWTSSPHAYNYDESGEDVFMLFDGKLKRMDGIFYNVDKSFYLYKLSSSIENPGLSPSYLYIRYYGHPTTIGVTETAYVIPATPELTQYLEFKKDYLWKEELVEIAMDLVATGSRIQLEATLKFGITPDYFLVDTLIFLQGSDLSHLDMSDIRDFCPSKNVSPPPTTTEYPEEDTTFPPDETTVEPPSNQLLECIDLDSHFKLFDWDSYPHHKYAQDETSLPFFQELDEGLKGTGIFYFEGSSGVALHVFFKDYSEVLGDLEGTQKIYIYLKYYTHFGGNGTTEGLSVYIQPVEYCTTEFAKPIPLGSLTDGVWEETFLQLNPVNDVVGGLVEIGIRDFQPGDYFLVDKIVVVSDLTFPNVLQKINSCL